jgi:hypothetical protein
MKIKRFTNKQLALLISIILIVTCTVGGTVAYIFTNTNEVVNVFTPAVISTDIEEEIDGAVKESVSIKNNSDMAVYVRAEVVVTWKKLDENGNVTNEVYAEAPVLGVDYELTPAASSKWIEYNGHYYYYKPVEAGAVTDALFTDGKAETTKEGYVLSMEVLTQSVQASPVDAIKDVWGVTISNGNVTPVPSN